MNVQLRTLGAFPRLLLGVLLLAWLAGCATVQHPDPRDPWESYNRSMTKFNNAVDKAVLKPVATAYVDVLPTPVRTGVGNFFGNLGDAWSFVNNTLQGKTVFALDSFWRVLINTTIGLGGVLDPATEMHLARHRQDFGSTLGYWGVGPGPYFVLPILGPSTLRDAAALPVDYYGNPAHLIDSTQTRNQLTALHLVDTRARLLGADKLIDQAALDPYSFIRDGYFQRRLNQIYDGNPPQSKERYDLDEPAPSPPAK